MNAKRRQSKFCAAQPPSVRPRPSLLGSGIPIPNPNPCNGRVRLRRTLTRLPGTKSRPPGIALPANLTIISIRSGLSSHSLQVRGITASPPIHNFNVKPRSLRCTSLQFVAANRGQSRLVAVNAGFSLARRSSVRGAKEGPSSPNRVAAN